MTQLPSASIRFSNRSPTTPAGRVPRAMYQASRDSFVSSGRPRASEPSAARVSVQMSRRK